MKNKQKNCSTGHGTGVSYARSLRNILADTKPRRFTLGVGGRRGEHDERGRCIPRKKLAYHHKKKVDPFALVDFWQKVMVR